MSNGEDRGRSGRENDPGLVLCHSLGLSEGETAFPWQDHLLSRFQRGDIPPALDIPTGLGKTAVMAIWLVARACSAMLPRRLVYVVDRRAVVDQATDVALSLRKFVDDDPELKARLGLREGRSLPISTLRGQYVDNREWLEDPAAPAIIVGTVDMVGSRLLFEGYGVSRKMRPYHAGLLGADTLVVLDEAHLVPPFEHLLRSVATEPALRSRDERCQQYVPPFRLLALSATGRTRGDEVVGLTEEDFKHEVVTRRLNAKKSLRIEALDTETRLEDALAKHAWMLADDGKKPVRVLVYSDSREIARKAKEAVEKLAKGDRNAGKPTVKIQTEFFVGSRRVFEREGATDRLKSLGFIAGRPVERSGPMFLFATSAGEVGVDLDADHMACDLVAWERMVQRLGRVNRRGDGEASVIVIVPTGADKKTQSALDKQRRGDELTGRERSLVERFHREKEVRQLIEQLPKNADESSDASPGALRELKTRAASDGILRKILHDATTPEPLRPALTRPLVEAWAMTSLEEHTGRPAIQPWLRGWIEDDPPQTAVVWRTHLPVRAGGPTPRKQEVEDFFEAAPPHTSEVLETEAFRVAKWIAARVKIVRKQQAAQDIAADEPRLREEEVVAFALDPDGGLRKDFRLAELDPPEDKKDKEELDRFLAGATLVLDARLAGLRDGLLNDTEAGLPRTPDDGQDWLGEGVVGFRVRSTDPSAGVPRERNWHERLRFASAVTEDGEATRWLIVEKWRHDAATEEDRSAANPQLLDEHQSWTEERARRLAKALRLDDALADVLALAARLHDEGKRAARWQRAFHAQKDGVYAKTEGPIDYRLLDGYRHELGSLLRVERDVRIQRLSKEYRDLVLHLIAAHHGFARPMIGTSGCEAAPPSALEEKAAEIALRFARLQDRWGPWGLAWWETLLRAADQQASRDNDARTAAGGGA
jgi:CRISPR-associated endonuclease/helicase Cas3